MPPASNQQPKILRFKREDLYEFLDTAVHESKHGYIESLFPVAPRDRHMLMMDQKRFDMLMRTLDSGEKETLQRMLSEANSTIVKVGRMPEAEAAKVKDSGRFTSDDDLHAPHPTPDAGPQARRPNPEKNSTFVPPKAPQPAKGEDLKAPIGSHGAAPKAAAKDADLYPPPVSKELPSKAAAKNAGLKLPPSTLGMGQPSIVKLPELKLPVVVPKEYLSSLAQNQLSVPSGKPQGKPMPEAANKYVTWADLIGVDQSGKKTTLADLLARDFPRPSRNVTFATQAQVREDHAPGGEITSAQPLDSVHEVNFGRKNPPKSLPKEEKEVKEEKKEKDIAYNIAKGVAVLGGVGIAGGLLLSLSSRKDNPSTNVSDDT